MRDNREEDAEGTGDKGDYALPESPRWRMLNIQKRNEAKISRPTDIPNKVQVPTAGSKSGLVVLAHETWKQVFGAVTTSRISYTHTSCVGEGTE